jgi:hypothetical protein
MVHASKKPHLWHKNYQMIHKHGSNYVESHVKWILKIQQILKIILVTFGWYFHFLVHSYKFLLVQIYSNST